MDDQSTPAPKAADPFDADSLTATQGLVQRLSSQLDELKIKQKELSDMLKGIFDNDEEMTQALEVSKEASQKLKERQSNLNATTEVKELRVKVADVREDLKMVQDSLDLHLVNYFHMTGTQSFPTPDGSEREFTLKAHLKPPKKA